MYFLSCHHQLLRCWIPRPIWRENTLPGPLRFHRLQSSLTLPPYKAMPKSRRNRTVRASTSRPQITGIKCAYIRPFSIHVSLSVVHFFCLAVLYGMFLICNLCCSTFWLAVLCHWKFFMQSISLLFPSTMFIFKSLLCPG